MMKLKSRRSIIVILMALMLSVLLALGITIFAQEGETAEAPAHSKTLTYNDDGTYNINLSVTGKTQTSEEHTKVNVVLVMDVSGSMNYYVTNAT
ncbi:MAG: hypothetical protein Q4B78_01565, partial [Bacillota bacterium]|nr:hypothetical protein [Bacillota bacterium]